MMMMNVLMFPHTGDGRGSVEWDGMGSERSVCWMELELTC